MLKKTLHLSNIYSTHGHKYEKIFKEESIKILKIIGWINNKGEYQKIYNHAWKNHKSRISTRKNYF